MSRSILSVLVLIAASVSLRVNARVLQVTAPSPTSYDGLAPWLKEHPEYQLFESYFNAQYGDESSNWSQGPTNMTVLVATDDAITEGLEQLATKNAVPGPSANFSDYLLSVITTAEPNKDLQDAVHVVIRALIHSHLIPGPVNLFKDQQILDAIIFDSVPLSTLATQDDPSMVTYASAWQYRGTPPVSVRLAQPNGQFHVNENDLKSLSEPSTKHWQFSDGVSTDIIYELDTIFVAGKSGDSDLRKAIDVIAPAYAAKYSN